VQVKHVHLSDRKRVSVTPHCHAEQAAGSNDVILRSSFRKVFQRCQRLLASLNLVEDDKGVLRQNSLPAVGGEFADYTFRVQIALKHGRHIP
jgi:hypothetical protein